MIAVLLAFLPARGVEAALHFRSQGLSAAGRVQLKEAFGEAYVRTQTCEALAARPELRHRALALYEGGGLRFEAVPRDEESPYECAYTLPGFLSGQTVHLHPMALTEDCVSLTSTVFHEVLHVAKSPGAVFSDLIDGGASEEAEVTILEHRCFPEFFTVVRGLQAP